MSASEAPLLKAGGKTERMEYDEETDKKITKLVRVDPDEALPIAENLAHRFPLNRRAWASLAYVWQAKGEYTKAARALKTAERVAPSEPVNQFDLANILVKLSQYSEAAEHSTKGIGLSIEHDFDYYLDAFRLIRALCYCKMRDFAKAKADLDLVEQEDPVWIDRLRSKKELLEACRHQFLD